MSFGDEFLMRKIQFDSCYWFNSGRRFLLDHSLFIFSSKEAECYHFSTIFPFTFDFLQQ